MTITSRSLLGAAALLLALTACGRNRSQTAPEARTANDPNTVTNDEGVQNVSVERILQGRIAGVNVTTTPDGSIAVRIRGGSSANEPLYIVDGIPVQAGANGALSGISPSDIESIRVLKDPADIAMYGIRGASGVVVVKTRRPKP